MVDPTPTDYHLSYLRDRWERDRSSRVFLQLAEEYRRRGLHAEALEVLGVGLSHHPGYLAAQVSLGRCRLEAGHHREAVEVLERVLAQDPTQAVASRLMVETRLQLRDLEGAREAIARCRLLGVVPPQELQAFQERLAAVAEERHLLAGTATAEGSNAAPDEVPSPVPSAVPSALGTAASPPPLVMDEPPPAAPQRPVAHTAAAAAATLRAQAATTASVPAAAKEASSLAAPSPTPAPLALAGWQEPPPPLVNAEVSGNGKRPGEVFQLDRKPLPPLLLPLAATGHRSRRAAPFQLEPEPSFAPVGDLAETAATAPEEEIFPLRRRALRSPERSPAAYHAPKAAAGATLVEPAASWSPATTAALPVAVAPLEPTPEAAITPAAEAPAEQESPWWRSAGAAALPTEVALAEATPASASVPAPRPAAPSAPSSPAPATSPVAKPEPRDRPAASPPGRKTSAGKSSGRPLQARPGVEVQPAGSLLAPELRPSDPGTATLADLYLRQGHLREAEEIFRQVLARDPENETALRGLETIGRRRGAALTAADLVSGDEPEVRGVTSRKILLLERYLRALRREKGSDVPRATE